MEVAIRNTLFCLFVLILPTKLVITEDNDEEEATSVYDFEDLLALEKEYIRSKLIADGEKQLLPAFEQLCYNAHKICVALLPNKKSVCAYHRQYGLLDFPNVCELRFQNCLATSYEERTGNKSRTGLFNYNAEGQPCRYYLDRAVSQEKAIQHYMLEDVGYIIQIQEQEKLKQQTADSNKK